MSNASAPPIVPPEVAKTLEGPQPPRTNDLNTGKKFRLTLGNQAPAEVEVVIVKEKAYGQGWFVEFKKIKGTKKQLLGMETFLDNSVMIDTTWLGGEK